MLVEVVQMRATGMKLTPDEVQAAPRHLGNLTITKDHGAFLHRGTEHFNDHVLPPLLRVRIGAMRGDEFMLLGDQVVSYTRPGDTHRQAWWCRVMHGPPLPSTPLFQGHRTRTATETVES